jgi:predicted Zn-dependent protease
MVPRAAASSTKADLADLDRARGKDKQSAELLKEAMAIEPDNADVQYALGLYLVRKRDYPGALHLLRRAHERMPDNARYADVFAVAMDSNGAASEAMALLEQTHRQHPADRDISMALVSFARDQGTSPRHWVMRASCSPSIPATRSCRLWYRSLKRKPPP